MDLISRFSQDSNDSRGVPKMEVPQVRWMVYNGTSVFKMDGLGVPPF